MESLADYRNIADPTVDNFLETAFSTPELKVELRQCLSNLSSNSSLNTLPLTYHDFPFIANAGKLPDWADVKLLKQGSAFFANHADLIMNLLGLLSLPYCYTAANGAMVLALSGRMDTDTGKRLFETAEFVWDVMDPDAFNSNGRGFAAILKIRLMHAAARYYVKKNDKWNKSYGLPVNQQDMAGTNLSFSFIVIRGLRKFGITISYQEQQSFQHLWNVIGYLLGVDEKLLPKSGKEAIDFEKAIKASQFKESNHGKILTKKLIDYFSTVSLDNKPSSQEISQIMRYLLEDDVADMLGISTSKLPLVKIGLIRNINYLKDLKITRNPASKFQEQYFSFKRNKPSFE
jgi:hypothetical protein